jgi:hypothetical protein
MEHFPEQYSVEPSMRAMFHRMLSAIIEKEKREATSGHFLKVDMRVDDLTDDDLVMFFRVKDYPGYLFPTRDEFLGYHRTVTTTSNTSRKAFVGYLANIYGAIYLRREFDAGNVPTTEE